jgi:hypothetical protein
VYNGGHYLKSAIRSVLAQTFNDFEFLIIDDCSTDSSSEVILSFRDDRIRLHTNEHNLGQTKSLNIGLRLARGKYVARIDADDLAYPRWLETTLGFMHKNPGCAVVGSSSTIIDTTGRVTRVFTKPTDEQEILFYYLYDNPVLHGSVLMDKEVVLRVGGYDEEFVICQDYELWSSLMRHGHNVANIPDMLVKIRTYEDSQCFRSVDRLVLESALTLARNNEVMSDAVISLESAKKIRYLFLFPEKMTRDDFREAESSFIAQYDHLKLKYQLEPSFVQAQLKGKMVKAYLKLAVAEMQTGKLSEARRITSDYLARYGIHPMVACINLASYCPRAVTSRIPGLYGVWQELAVPKHLR